MNVSIVTKKRHLMTLLKLIQLFYRMISWIQITEESNIIEFKVEAFLYDECGAQCRSFDVLCRQLYYKLHTFPLHDILATVIMH